jgi:uncharacterized protein with beta-barrel porin domain
MTSAILLRIFGCGSSLALATGLATGAQASGDIIDAGGRDQQDPYIVVTDGIKLNQPPPNGAYDRLVDVTGVGQMVVDSGDGFVGLCTGTLINARTVIFAAHCVNDEAAEDYGSASGGTPISFGFSADNLPALRRWLGLDGGTLHATDTGENLYNVEQVWYDERSLPTGFLEADIALATLDTHADGVPTWAMLFSPLTGQAHALLIGYGSRGYGLDGDYLGIDFRRRVAENMISVLGSLEDRNDFLFGPDDYGLPQNLYQLDFDNPGGIEDPKYGYLGDGYDFDVFGGPALPREGITAGGDSGGPLIVDEAFHMPVVAGVLSGGSRYFADQPSSSYGTSSFYQPLFMFWESIVANNSYVYASGREGSRNWNTPSHWVQDMDPAYNVIARGELVNALPGFDEPGVTGDTPQFGDVCFLDECESLAGGGTRLPTGRRNSVFVPGGPGSTYFVPDNVVADPAKGVKARYYEVTLAKEGMTTLTDSKTIDRVNIAGDARLRIRRSGDLTVWGDYTQLGGVLELDGRIATGEAFLGSGLIEGTGVFDPTYLTNLAGVISPGEFDRAGRLTVVGDVILSSQAVTLFNLERNRSDLLLVQGDGDNSGEISVGGLAYFLPGVFSGPTYGRTYTIVEAEGGVVDRFNSTHWSGLGVLYPELVYTRDTVGAEIKALPFTGFLEDGGVDDRFALAFGKAFDALRGSNYAGFAGVFDTIDVMGVSELAATFSHNAAALAGDLAVSDERQNSFVRRLVSDRLSLMGTRGAGGSLSLVGDGAGMAAGRNVARSSAAQLSFAQAYRSRDIAGLVLPENVGGFMSSGYRRLNDAGRASGARDESGTWHMAMGLEVALDRRNAIGSAFAHSRGERQAGGTLANIATSHAALYGAHQLGGGAYVGGQVSLSHSALDAASNAPIAATSLSLDSQALSYSGEVELGYNHALGDLTLTPRTRLEYASYAIDGFQDRQSRLGMGVGSVERAGLDWRAGLRLSGSTALGRSGEWALQPEVQVDYVRRISGNDTRLDVTFLAAEGLGVSVPVALHDGEYGELRGGVTLTDGRLSFGAALEKQVGQDLYRDDRGVVSVSYAF